MYQVRRGELKHVGYIYHLRTSITQFYGIPSDKNKIATQHAINTEQTKMVTQLPTSR